MRMIPPFVAVALVLTFVAASTSAQTLRQTSFPTQVVLGKGADLVHDAGALLGFGESYKVRFADGQFEFTPYLGMAAPHDLPLSIAVTHTGRGQLQAVGPATTRRQAMRVDFERAQLREQLEVLANGLKQSFVFDELPPGSGDLTVRVRVTSELRPATEQTDGAMLWSLPSIGGIEIAQVVGIDASGARVTGTMRVDGDALDFVLPAAFVDAATLPIVLDPLLSTLTVSGSSSDDDAPMLAAMRPPINFYLVAWLRTVSASNHDVFAQRVRADGTVLGSPITIEASTADVSELRLATGPDLKWFLVWNQGNDIVGRLITPQGLPAPPLNIASGAAVQTKPVIGGGNLVGQQNFVCAWRDVTANAIKARSINSQTSVMNNEVTLATGAAFTGVDDPALSADNNGQRMLLTWSTNSVQQLTRSVRGLLLDPLANPIGTTGQSFLIANGAARPRCAGDGEHWVVAYEMVSITSQGHACVAVQTADTGASVGTPRVLLGGNGAVQEVDVATFGESVMVAFTSQNGAAHDVTTLSMDPFTCADCEGALLIDVGNNGSAVAIASRAANTPSLNQGAVAFRALVGSQGDIRLGMLAGDDGVVANLGGGCAPGDLFATCARAGNAAFRVRLQNGLANDFIFALHATSTADLPCGPCVVVPDPVTGVIQSLGLTASTGDAEAPLPLPGSAAIIGLAVNTQFFHLGTSCVGLFQLTDAIRFTIE